MNTRKILKASFVVGSGLFVVLLAACQNPTTSSPVQHTISGVVRDTITGAAVPGATVVMGSYTAKTDSSGKYMITLGSGETSVTGAFAVSDGTAYDFEYDQSGSLDASSDPSNVNVRLVPAVAPTASVTLSGTVSDSSGSAIPNGSTVGIVVVNQNGGSSTESSNYNGGYSISTPTTGSDCFVAVWVTYPTSSNTPPAVFYLKNQSITASSSAYNLQIPSTGATTVSVSGAPSGTGAAFGMGLDVPGYGSVVAYAEKSSSSFPPKVTVYDPDNYQAGWGSYITQTSSAPETIQLAITAEESLASSGALPQFSYAPTTQYDDVTSGSYSNGVLTFTTSTDASVNIHLVQLIPVNSGGNQIGQMMGILWLLNGNVTLPASIQSVISDEIKATTGNTWGIAAFAGEETGITTEDRFANTDLFGKYGVIGMTGIQFAVAAGTVSVDSSGFMK